MRKREKRRWERGNAEAEADEEDGRECMRQVSNQYRAMAMCGPFSGLQLAAPPAYTCVSSLHTRRSVSVHIFIIIIIHMSFSRTEGPCSLEIHVARSHSVCRSLGLWIINSPSPAQLIQLRDHLHCMYRASLSSLHSHRSIFLPLARTGM